ncbi:hypothetical protein [Mycobacterium sp. NPDC050853]|uniref:hypothetical protein n=1 Tax=Mycobacterium sp. NPDC050853 TaxID=3155160 RepID=UPI0033E53873
MVPDGVPGYGVEWASSMGMALLDELRVSMIESLLVLEALPGQVDLNLDELRTELCAALRSARQAASLLNQGAALAQAWGAGFSRPQAVFARHKAAVRNGAPRMSPASSGTEQLEKQLAELDAAAGMTKSHGTQPVCSASTQSSGQPCRSKALPVSPGVFGQSCYQHASPEEKARYRVRQAGYADYDDTRRGVREMHRAAGVGICADWMARREDMSRWFHEAQSLTALADQ